MRVLTLTEIRRRLYWSNVATRTGDGNLAAAGLLGEIFHELYAALTGTNGATNLAAPLELADASVAAWRQSLIDHAFTAVIAPALARHEATLQTLGAEVLGFWTAARELCGWLAEVMHEQRAADSTRSLEAVRRQVFGIADADVEAELPDPSWPEPIRVRGRPAATQLRHAAAERCAVEFTLGRTDPEADLLQSCVYQLLLTRRDSAAGGGALALMSFEPQRRERVFSGSQLHAADGALKTLLNEMAAREIPDPGAERQKLRHQLVAAFAEYGAVLAIDEEWQSGPTFVRFFVTPQRGVSLRRLVPLAEKVRRRLGTQHAPQIALHRGRITIDVERRDRHPAKFADWRVQLPSPAAAGSTRFAVGVGADGELHSADLSDTQSPHVLVVGSPGSGKSEWLRAFLASLLATNSPATLRLALIDSKRAAFAALEHSAFLWKPIVHDRGAVALLDEMIEEMERRREWLRQSGAEDLEQYNARRGNDAAQPSFPRLIGMCDEFSDLLLRDKLTRTALEERIARIGVHGRAAGVHLVFATQRTGRDILNGAIDANLPARVALTVARKVDSRFVLGEAGAESLLGEGDLLYKDIGAPVRLQGLLVSRDELSALADETRAAAGPQN